MDNVLKEFLVKLGFKVDESSNKKMNTAVRDITKSINELGLAIDLSVAGMTAWAVKASEALDKLYFASQRTGSAIQDIKAFDYATAQMGGSADSAQASLENLAHFIRSYPGSEAFLMKLGVAPDHVHDAAKAMEDLGKTFQRMPFWQAQPYANMLGIDEKTLLALQSGQMNKWIDDYNARLKEVGLNEEDAGKAGNKFMTAIRGLEAEASIAGDALVSGPFGKALLWVIDKLTDVAEGMAFIFKDPLKAATTLNTAAANKLRAGASSVNSFLTNQMMQDTARVGRALGERQNNPGNLRSWGNNPVANGFASFSSPAAGLSAEAGQLMRYGSRGWDTLRAIIGHWAPSSENNTEAYIKAMERSTGFGASQKLNMNDRGTLERLMHGINTHEQGRDIFGADLYSRALDSRLGATINQNTTINVHGNDANAIATAVAGQQNNVNNQFVRNMGGAVR